MYEDLASNYLQVWRILIFPVVSYYLIFQENDMTAVTDKLIVGIDVGKAELSIYLNGEIFSIQNDLKPVAKWFKEQRIKSDTIDLIAFEPTGGYENILLTYVRKNKIPYKMVHANYVRSYAKSSGQLAKTDSIDARIIAEYARAMKVEPETREQLHEELRALLDRRDELINMKKQDDNRLETEADKVCIKSIKNHVKWLDKEIVIIEGKMKAYLAADEQAKEQIDLYQSIPCIGWLTAMRVYVDLPELASPHFNEKSLAALVGIAPMNRDSGKMHKRRKIYGGRKKVRTALYMAVVSAIRCNSVIKPFYKRLKQRGKPSVVAMIASERKLLMILHSIAKRQTKWVDELPATVANTAAN